MSDLGFLVCVALAAVIGLCAGYILGRAENGGSDE